MSAKVDKTGSCSFCGQAKNNTGPGRVGARAD